MTQEIIKKLLARTWHALIWILGYIPVIQSLTSFRKVHHKVAIKKFLWLWILSIIPGFFSLFLLSSNQPQTVLGQFRAAFTPAEQFVFAVAFLTPTLYLLWERHQQKDDYIAARKRSPEILAIVPRGFDWVFLLTILALFYTSAAFGAAKAWEQATPNTLQHRAAQIAVQSAVWVYLFGVFCWYLTILMSVDAEWIDFVSETRDQEDAVKAGLGKRLGSRGGADAQ